MIKTLWENWKNRPTNQISAPIAVETPLNPSEVQENEEIREGQKVQQIGTVREATEDFYVVVNSTGDELYVTLPDIKQRFISGDEVRLTGYNEEIGDTVKFEVTSMVPEKTSIEFGNVSALGDGFVVFNKRHALIISTLETDPSLKLYQQCKYEVIKSIQKLPDGQSFEERVLTIIEIGNVENIEENIIVKNVDFKIAQNSRSFIQKNIAVFNKSNVAIELLEYNLANNNSSSNLIQLRKVRAKKFLAATNGMFKIPLDIRGTQRGTYSFVMETLFKTENDQKILKFSRIVVEVYAVKVATQALRDAPRFIRIRFKDYFVPDDVRSINFSQVSTVSEKFREAYPYLREELSPDNYLKKMRISLYIEEIAMETAFEGYKVENASFDTDERGDLKLKVKDVAEKRPSIAIGDRVEAIGPYRDGEQIVHRGLIEFVGDDEVLLKFSDNFKNNYADREYTVCFISSRAPFKQQQHALEMITMRDGLGFDFLFPAMENLRKRYSRLDAKLENGKLIRFGSVCQWYDQKLNLYQKQAVVNIMRGEARPMPYIIYGPPGTGKTMTVVELIQQLFFGNPKFRLIISTPSNSAANSFTEALANSERFERDDFIRIVSNNVVEKEQVPDYLASYCATVSVDENGENQVRYKPEGLRKNLRLAELKKFRICIGTLSCFASFMQMGFPKDHFTHVIIDEAGQSVEPLSLIPLTLLTKGSAQIVLTGDPKQLGPISVTKVVKNLNLDMSMLERLLTKNPCYAQIYGLNKNEYDERFVTKLKINYRSLPSVLSMYNELFYNSELEGAISADNSPEADLLSFVEASIFNKPSKKVGIFFYNVNGRDARISNSCSWYNEAEMNQVYAFLAQWNNAGLSFNDIGVITPYALQRKKLKEKVAGLPGADLKVGTVEEFQGQERQAILVSTVRTNEKHFEKDKKFCLGFVQCPLRINVAISRAKSLLIVFGKEKILATNEHWKHLIEYTKANGTFIQTEKLPIEANPAQHGK